MPSALKKKMTVKSDTWYVDANVIRTVGFQESPLFGTESTKFYWRAEKRELAGYGNAYSLHLYLAACKEEKVDVKVEYCYGRTFPQDFKFTHMHPFEGGKWAFVYIQ